MVLDNAAPQIFGRLKEREISESELDDSVSDPIDAREIFDLIKDIKDPEHPLTLEELNVVSEEQISIDEELNLATVEFTPTINHCSMAPIIGLSIIVKLLRSLPDTMKIDVKLAAGSHESENEYNKQLNDKERVAAALENIPLLRLINTSIYQ